MIREFENTAVPVDPRTHCPWVSEDRDVGHYYGFDRVPRLLFPWSRAFQTIISQAGTKLLTGKFHDHDAGIYKSEGGCKIVGVNDLVLYKDYCRWDYGSDLADKNTALMAQLITAVVLGFDPMDPVDTLLKSASDFLYKNGVETTTDEIKKAGFEGGAGGVFGGDSLSSFFDHNPFAKWEHDRDYLRYCYVKDGMTNEEVDQKFADEDLGNALLKSLNKKFRPDHHFLCCSPRRNGDDLKFWLNTGSFCGWYDQDDIEGFISSGKLPEKE